MRLSSTCFIANSGRVRIKLLWSDFQIGEIAFGTGADPERDSTFRIAQFQVIHDEAGLGYILDV